MRKIHFRHIYSGRRQVKVNYEGKKLFLLQFQKDFICFYFISRINFVVFIRDDAAKNDLCVTDVETGWSPLGDPPLCWISFIFYGVICTLPRFIEHSGFNLFCDKKKFLLANFYTILKGVFPFQMWFVIQFFLISSFFFIFFL